MQIILTLLAVFIAFVIGARTGFEAGYKTGVLDTVSLYRVLYAKAELARKEAEPDEEISAT